MAFHPYPQVIPQVFNPGGFGPPRGLTLASTCPWVDHPASGLGHATKRPMRTRFRSGFPRTVNLAARRELAGSFFKRHAVTRPWLPRNRLRQLVGPRFQVLFHSPPGVLFTFPSRYWFTIGRQGVLSLGGWAPQIRTEYPPCYSGSPRGGQSRFDYRAVTCCGGPFHGLRLRAGFVTP